MLLGIFSFRFNRRISEPGMPGDVLVDVDHSGTGREGCNVSTLAITCEPRDWQTATQVQLLPCAFHALAWSGTQAGSPVRLTQGRCRTLPGLECLLSLHHHKPALSSSGVCPRTRLQSRAKAAHHMA